MGSLALRPVGANFMGTNRPARPVPMLPLHEANKGLAFRADPAQTRGAFGAQIALTVLVSVALFMLFILAFFFLLTRNVEKHIVTTSVQRVVDTLSGELKALLPPQQAAGLGVMLQRLQPPDAAAQDAEVQARNSTLTKHAGLVVGLVAGVVIVIAVGVFMGMKSKKASAGPGLHNYPDPVKVLLCATFGFAAVALCELVFLYGIAGRYQPLDTAATRNDVLDALIEQIEALPTS